MQVWRSGRVGGYRSKGCWFTPSLCSLVFRGQRASNVKLRILECFTLYLHNRQSGNLRAIENCICGLRSIERNMRSFLRTVQERLSSPPLPLLTCINFQHAFALSSGAESKNRSIRSFLWAILSCRANKLRDV